MREERGAKIKLDSMVVLVYGGDKRPKAYGG